MQTYTKEDLKQHLADMGLRNTDAIMVRSLHPTHSIAAFGPMASDYIKGEENVTTPCQPGGCWDRFRKVNAKILLIGVTHIRNTFIHAMRSAFCVMQTVCLK